MQAKKLKTDELVLVLLVHPGKKGLCLEPTFKRTLHVNTHKQFRRDIGVSLLLRNWHLILAQCINYLSLYKITPKLVAQSNTHYFMISVRQKPGRSLAGSSASGSPMKLQSRCCRWSHLKAQLGKDLLLILLHELLAGFSSLKVVGLKVSVSFRLFPRGHPQFLAMWASPKWQLASSKPAIECLQDKSHDF